MRLIESSARAAVARSACVGSAGLLAQAGTSFRSERYVKQPGEAEIGVTGVCSVASFCCRLTCLGDPVKIPPLLKYPEIHYRGSCLEETACKTVAYLLIDGFACR